MRTYIILAFILCCFACKKKEIAEPKEYLLVLNSQHSLIRPYFEKFTEEDLDTIVLKVYENGDFNKLLSTRQCSTIKRPPAYGAGAIEYTMLDTSAGENFDLYIPATGNNYRIQTIYKDTSFIYRSTRSYLPFTMWVIPQYVIMNNDTVHDFSAKEKHRMSREAYNFFYLITK